MALEYAYVHSVGMLGTCGCTEVRKLNGILPGLNLDTLLKTEIWCKPLCWNVIQRTRAFAHLSVT